VARYVYRVQVYNSQIHGMFLPGGEVNREATDITREVEVRAVAKATAFARSGEIARSHRRSVVPSGPLYGTRGYVENDAPHALYKHRGTTVGMRIRSSRGTTVDRRGHARPAAMQLRPGNGYGYLLRSEVSGYSPDKVEPWLLDAANEVLLRYGVRARDDGDVTPL
jgi:hypothetical protein